MTATHSPSDCHSAEAGCADPHHGLVAAFLDHLGDQRPIGDSPLYSNGGPARHFLLWLDRLSRLASSMPSTCQRASLGSESSPCT
jgi:hypothetical protein